MNSIGTSHIICLVRKKNVYLLAVVMIENNNFSDILITEQLNFIKLLRI